MSQEKDTSSISSPESSPKTSPRGTPPREPSAQRQQQRKSLSNSSSSEKYAEVGDPDEIQKSIQLLQNQQPPKPIQPPPQTVLSHLSKSIQKVFQTAFDERKYLNQSDFGQYIKKRNLYFQKHCMTLESIVYQLNLKIKETTSFIPYLIKHFHQVAQSHRAYIDGCKKIEVFKFLNIENEKKETKNRHEWFPDMMKGIKMLMNLKQQMSTKHKTMEHHLLQQLIPSIQRSLQTYTKTLQSSNKTIEKQKDLYKDIQNTAQKKLARVNKMFQNHHEKKDWLSYQIATFQLLELSKKQLVSFGNLVYNYWNQIINHEKTLAESVQKIVTQLLQNYRLINTSSKQFEQYVYFWGILKVDADIDAKFKISNVLVLSSLDFLRSSLKIKNISKQEYELKDFQIFTKMNLEKDVFGNKEEILNSLMVKRFIVQRQGQQNTHKSIILYSTVDHYLVFFDPENPSKVNKMQIKRLLNTRKSDHAVNVNEKIQGFIMDSWNKETIYFSSADQAQEFMFHTESNQEMKNSYLN